MTELFTSFGQAIINRIDIIIGGLIGIAASFITVWYQSKKAHQIRLAQSLAEKQINVLPEAYGKLSYIEGMHLPCRPEAISERMFKHDDWVFNNCLYLPDEFSEKWCAIRRDLLKLKQLYSRDTRDSYKIGELEDSTKNTTAVSQICP